MPLLGFFLMGLFALNVATGGALEPPVNALMGEVNKVVDVQTVPATGTIHIDVLGKGFDMLVDPVNYDKMNK